jgi:ArsR family transcriptional regulator, arsenate/arsenite/antimonite-responsive transcriptional repressor
VKLLEEPSPATKPVRNSPASTTTTSTQGAADELGGGGSKSALSELCNLFKLLADDTRLQILNLLLQTKEHHVRALCEQLGQSQPAVSHHLALLRTAGFIECRREGKHNFYRLAPERFENLLDSVVAAGAGGANRQKVLQLGRYTLRRDA